MNGSAGLYHEWRLISFEPSTLHSIVAPLKAEVTLSTVSENLMELLMHVVFDTIMLARHFTPGHV